jgi:hypothetical protein
MDNWNFLKAIRRLYRVRRLSRSGDSSYGGEFAAINGLLARIGVSNGYIVDVAASDGVSQSSTLPLFAKGWAGLAVEMDPWKFAALAFIYSDFKNARLARARVTPINIASLLNGNEVPTDFDLLNLDIDSYDFFVIKAMLESNFRPKVISMEINEKIPVPVYFTVKYDEAHYWQGDHFFGCSLTAAGKLLREHGYILVSVEYNNAMFVRLDCAGSIVDVDDETAWRSGYADRKDRLSLFPWNAEVEGLMSMTPNQALAEVDRMFSKYRGKYEASL